MEETGIKLVNLQGTFWPHLDKLRNTERVPVENVEARMQAGLELLQLLCQELLLDGRQLPNNLTVIPWREDIAIYWNKGCGGRT